jgi:hypothetical protein
MAVVVAVDVVVSIIVSGGAGGALECLFHRDLYCSRQLRHSFLRGGRPAAERQQHTQPTPHRRHSAPQPQRHLIHVRQHRGLVNDEWKTCAIDWGGAC